MRLGERRHLLGECAGRGLAHGRPELLRQLRRIQHAAIAPHRDVGLARLRFRRLQEVGEDLRAGLGLGIDRDRQEMNIADGAAGKAETVSRGRQLPGDDQIRRFVGVEGERQLELAIGQQAVHLGSAGRETLALPPGDGMQLIEIRPERRGRALERLRRHRLLQSRCVGRQLKENLFDEGRAMKIRQLGIAHAPRIGLGESQQFVGRARRRGGDGVVGDERELRRSPRGLHAVSRHREIDANRFRRVDQRPIRQRLRPWAEKQAGLL